MDCKGVNASWNSEGVIRPRGFTNYICDLSMLVLGEQSVSMGMVGRLSISMLPMYDDGNDDEK
jgi:hypothetical protein